MGIQEVSAFRGIQEVSAHRVCRELINHLCLFAWPLKVDYGLPFVNNAKIKKYIYSHLTKYICTQGIILQPATVYLCSFKELFIQLQGNDILVNCKEIDSFKGHIFIHKKSNHSRQLYSFTESYSFQGTYQFILGNISSFKENTFIQGHYIHSRIYINLRNIYSFKFRAMCSFKETIFIEHRCVRGHSRNIYSKIVPSRFMIIIIFTITISWINYSYNPFRLKDEEIVDMIEGSLL